MYSPFFFLRLGLPSLKCSGRTVRCRCLEPGWFVGDPTPPARDTIYVFGFGLWTNRHQIPFVERSKISSNEWLNLLRVYLGSRKQVLSGKHCFVTCRLGGHFHVRALGICQSPPTTILCPTGENPCPSDPCIFLFFYACHKPMQITSTSKQISSQLKALETQNILRNQWYKTWDYMYFKHIILVSIGKLLIRKVNSWSETKIIAWKKHFGSNATKPGKKYCFENWIKYSFVWVVEC